MKKIYFLTASLIMIVAAISTGFACTGATYEPKIRS